MSKIILAKKEFAKKVASIVNDLEFVMKEKDPETVIDGIRRAIASKYKISLNQLSTEAKTKQQVKAELEEVTKHVEEYLAVEKLIQAQVQEFQDKLEKRMNLEKLKSKLDEVRPNVEELVKDLGEHKAIVSSVLYKLKKATTRTDTVDVETASRIIELIKKLINEDKMKRFRQLSRKMFVEHDIKEKIDYTLLDPEDIEGQKAKIEKEREKARASLKVQSGFWQSIKQFFSDSLGFLKGDKEAWEEALFELDEIIA